MRAADSDANEGSSSNGGGGGNADSAPADQPQNRFEGLIPAPAFADGLEWINVATPPSWPDFRGKVVVLDFWTYGCINCIHMIPVLEQLQEKYADELVVIGVHSAKFENEGSTENISQIAARYGRSEPIVNDVDFVVWRSWGARAWPTIGVVDPSGNVLALQSGEIPYSTIDNFVGNVVSRFDELGLVDRSPLLVAEPETREPDSLLRFPGKVLADAGGERLFIADSNHNRIIIANLESGDIIDVVGSGAKGLTDGEFEIAEFAKPQGLALTGETLYVADLDNNVIRQVDLSTRVVQTVAGTGVRGAGRPPVEPLEDPTSFDLRSSWALEFGDGASLYVAMAGTHQIWVFDTDSMTLGPAVGSSREALFNAILADSALAQPSGLHYDDGKLYFADSESSSIRIAHIRQNFVSTISGPARDSLFDFGDVDGKVGTSLLQHPLGVTGSPTEIYIADTYNSRIKSIDSESVTTTLFGLGGSGGYRDGNAMVAEFDEPGGLDYANGKLYVADTNNHAIRVIDLAEGIVETFVLGRVEKILGSDQTVTLLGSNSGFAVEVALDEQGPGAGEGGIIVDIELPSGYKLNPRIDSRFGVSFEGEAGVVESGIAAGGIESLSVDIPALFSVGRATISIQLFLYYCETQADSVCILDESVLKIPVNVVDSGASEVIVSRRVELPELPSFGEL